MPTPTSTRHSELLAGFRAELPILLGVIPFGMIYGVLALQAGLPVSAAQAMSAVVFAGSAQFMSVQLVSSVTPALVMVLSILVINLRHTLYSASVAPYLKGLSLRWRGLLAYLLTDEAYAVTITHYQQAELTPLSHWFFLGAGLTLWIGWQISTAVGIFLGAQNPSQLVAGFYPGADLHRSAGTLNQRPHHGSRSTFSGAGGGSGIQPTL
jgi:4-azaleucine resistance transporter AzlC